MQDIVNRTVQIHFRAFSANHSGKCVPEGTETRPTPLIGAWVAVKEIGRDITARPSQIEQGVITTSSASHHPDTVGFMVSQAPTLSIGAIRKTLEHSRSVGREDGDFSAVHAMLAGAAAQAEADGTLQQFRII